MSSRKIRSFIALDFTVGMLYLMLSLLWGNLLWTGIGLMALGLAVILVLAGFLRDYRVNTRPSLLQPVPVTRPQHSIYGHIYRLLCILVIAGMLSPFVSPADARPTASSTIPLTGSGKQLTQRSGQAAGTPIPADSPSAPLAVRYVAPTGADSGDCTNSADPCHTVQYAVDQAAAGDEIRVAAGTYTGVQGHPVPTGYPYPPASGIITQAVYINKTVTVRGGYTTADWNTSDPNANSTTLDAQGQGRALVVAGVISPTVEGLRLTGGKADGLGGAWWFEGDGGSGAYVISATVTISNTRVFSNVITNGYGGGLYLYSDLSTLISNAVYSNTAYLGGGLVLEDSDATLRDNAVYANTADDDGGGLYLENSYATLGGNTIYVNTTDGDGGGLFLDCSDVALSGNTVYSNTAEFGGGLHMFYSDATLSGNAIYANTADDGGGLYLYKSNAGLTGNTVYANAADDGGGLYLNYSDATLSSNTVYTNTADSSGGGLYLVRSGATLTGNTVYANTADSSGGGLYLARSGATLTGNTVYTNTADDGGGLYLDSSDATLSGNIVYSNAAYLGGGLYLESSGAMLTNNAVYSNTAGSGGGGLYLKGSNATLTADIVSANTANAKGGGLYLDKSNATLTANEIISNTAGGSGLYDGGGGLYLKSSNAALSDNTVVSNTASNNGGGLYLYSGSPTLDGNEIINNTAGGSGLYDGGGGLYLYKGGAVLIGNMVGHNTAAANGGGFYLESSKATLQANRLAGNTAGNNGGGAYLWSVGDDATLDGNTVISNTASNGGGLYLYLSNATLRANVVVENRATTAGSGIYVEDSRPELLYTTIADNGNTGLYVTGYSSAPTLINTILASHTVGITATAGTATLNGVLWSGNGTNTGGAGTIAVTHDVTGTPAFVNPAGGDYHILPTSTAVDHGVAHDYPLDIDGDYRPLAAPPDLGADEVLTTTPPCRARLNGGTVYATVQAAFDASAASTDLVEVAGVCTDTVAWNGGTYAAVLTKTLTVRGGYSSDFATWNPNTYPTLLDGLWQGSVLALDGTIRPTVEYLTLLGGQAMEGGGLWSDAANPTLRYLRVSNNIAGLGGGVMLRGASGRLEYSQVTDNRAAHGGGVYLLGSSGTVFGNTVQDNTATGNNGGGGGLYLESSDATLLSNTVSGNTTLDSESGGGGLYLHSSHNAMLSGNTVQGNAAGNSGGGLILDTSDDVMLTRNAILSNTAQWNGGGVYLFLSDGDVLESNVIRGNAAGLDGGGALLLHSDNTTMINNVVVDNRIGSSRYGSGVYIAGSTPVYLRHTTIHDNTGGDGSGVCVRYWWPTYYSNVWMTNTIVTSQTVGVSLDSDNTASMNGVLWAGNGSNTSGSVVVTNEHTGSPAFAADGYHLRGGSDAIDQGVNAGVTTDIDGEVRPQGGGYDLGADEYWPCISLTSVTIGGPSTTPIGTATTFNATIRPSEASGPVVYTWSPGPDSGQGTAGATYTWVTSGTKSITVTARNCGGVASDTRSITITNEPPVADAGPDRSVQVNATVTLDGSASHDPDGHLPLAYGWAQTGGPSVALNDATTVSPTFIAPSMPTVLTFTLAVTDAYGLPDPTPDDVVVIVEAAPCTVLDEVAVAGPATTTVDTAATLIATVAPPTVTLPITYTWEATGQTPLTHTGELSDTATFTWAVTGLQVVTVTAVNPCSVVSTTQAITVEGGERDIYLPFVVWERRE